MEQLITIDVFGQTYTFKADAGKTDPKMAADFLMDTVRKLDAGQGNRTVGNSQFILLLQAALNISSEHMQLKQQLIEMSHRIAEQTERLYSLLEDGWSPDTDERREPFAG